MGALWTKLQHRWSRDRHLPVGTRIRSEVQSATGYVGSALAGLVLRRQCSSVGSWARVAGGLPRIENRGFIGIGSHSVLVSAFCPVQLVAEPGGRVEIGDGVVINFGTVIAARARVSIGHRASIGPYCVVSDADRTTPSLLTDSPEEVVIEDDVWIAAHVTVAPGARIGKGSVITAGSHVAGKIPPGVVAGGSPARVLRKIEQPDAASPTDLASAAAAAAPAPAAPVAAAASSAARSSAATPSAATPSAATPSGATPSAVPPSAATPSGATSSAEASSAATRSAAPRSAATPSGATPSHGASATLGAGAANAGAANAETARRASDPLAEPSAPGTVAKAALASPSADVPAAAQAPSLHGLLVSDFTIQPLADVLNETSGPPRVEFETAPYGQVIPTLISPPPGVDVVVVWTRPEAVAAGFGRVLHGDVTDLEDLRREVDAFCDVVRRCAQSVKTVLVASWTVPAYVRGLGMIDARKGGLTRALASMNLRLMERLDDVPNVYVLPAQRWTEHVGRAAYPPKLWYMGKVPYHPEVWLEAAADIKATLAGVAGQARKLLILDLDDTLWGGIVGDVGWESLRLGGHDAIGEAFVDFQHAIKALQKRGIVLGIVSKNTEEVALEAIRKHPAMVLRESDFVAHRINWRDKARNVAELVAELNLGLQSVVFIDDNPVERARVRESLPEVFVPEWPEDKTLYASTLTGLRCFDAPAISKEDLERTQMYSAERKRETLKTEVGSLDDWLGQLGIKVFVEPLKAENLARTTQLLNKTNQMNLSTRRLSEQELQAWVAGAGRRLWAIRVSDRFGDAGLTGIASLELRAEDHAARIVDFVLSCRVMGRKIEEAMAHVLVEAARKEGARSVEVQYLPTAKNKPCLEFWQRSGFEAPAESRFVWTTEHPYPLPQVVELHSDEQS